MRVTIGVNKIPIICEIIGTEERIRMSSENDFFLFKTLAH